MKPLLVIQTGETTAQLREDTGGDFDDWTLQRMGLPADEAVVVKVYRGESLPAHEDISAVVITGSPEMISSHRPWSERTAAWLPGVLERRIPTLGICYGHQLLAYALGGEVRLNLMGPEFGSVDVTLTGEAAADPLLGEFSSPVHVMACHFEAVTRLPRSARLLGFNDMDAHHAFAVGECAWGVQFHPEFNAHIVRTYIRDLHDELTGAGRDPDSLVAACRDTDVGPKLLRRFLHIARSR